jgi:hypothetical protein
MAISTFVTAMGLGIEQARSALSGTGVSREHETWGWKSRRAGRRKSCGDPESSWRFVSGDVIQMGPPDQTAPDAVMLSE